MKLYDYIKVKETSEEKYLRGEIGKVVEFVEEDHGVEMFRVKIGVGFHLLADYDCEVVYDEKDRKYSYDLWKQYMLKRHDDLTVALLINMGGGDSYNDGKTAEYMREHGRIVIPEWYYYDTDLI